jgi:hypothetical protein
MGMITIGNRSRQQFDIHGLPPIDPKTGEVKTVKVGGREKPAVGAGPFSIKPTRPNKSGTLVMGTGQIPEEELVRLLDDKAGDDFTKGLFGLKGGPAKLFKMNADQVSEQIVATQKAAEEDAKRAAATGI